MDDPGDIGFLERDLLSVPSATFGGYPLHTSKSVDCVSLFQCGAGSSGFLFGRWFGWIGLYFLVRIGHGS